MIATNSNATDYSDPRYAAEMETCGPDFDADVWRLERAAWISECRIELFRRLGAKVSRHRVLWWPAGCIGLFGPQRRNLSRLRYFAGVPSHHRGRHWNRKRRSI